MKKLILIILISTLTSCNGYNFYDILSTFGDPSPHLARNLSFLDDDYTAGEITGTFKFSPASSESNITEYRIYWGNSSSTKISLIVTPVLTPNGSDQTFTFLANTLVPAGATHFLVYSVKGSDEMTTPASLKIKDLVVEQLGAVCTAPGGLTVIDGVLYFGAFSGGLGQELHKSDGSALGTSQVMNFNGVGNGLDSTSWVIGFNGKLYLKAQSSAGDLELWIYDPAGPPIDFISNPILIDINIGFAMSNPSNPIFLNGKLYFTADDGINGIELWELTPAASYSPGPYNALTNPKLINIYPGGALSSSSPSNLTVLNGKLYFIANDGTNGIELLELIPAGSYSVGINPKLIDINTGPPSSSPANLIVYNGKLYFSATTALSGNELMSYNGASVVLVNDIYSGLTGSSPAGLTLFNNKFVFAATDLIYGREPWISDGTAAGTYMIRDMNTSGHSSISGSPFILNNKVYFSLATATGFYQLGISDGTYSGTIQKVINLGNHASPIYFTSYNGLVYFIADDGSVDGKQVFRSDGTSAGTVKLTDSAILNSGGNPGSLTEFNGKIFFSGFDGISYKLYVLYYK